MPCRGGRVACCHDPPSGPDHPEQLFGRRFRADGTSQGIQRKRKVEVIIGERKTLWACRHKFETDGCHSRKQRGEISPDGLKIGHQLPQPLQAEAIAAAGMQDAHAWPKDGFEHLLTLREWLGIASPRLRVAFEERG